MNPPILVSGCFTDGCGSIHIIIINYMKKEYNEAGYLPNGTPVDFIDENGIKWIYKGKCENGVDKWDGIPNE